MRVSEMKKLLRKKTKCYKIREGKRHEIWVNPETGREFQVLRHDGEELANGTADAIKKAAGLK